MQLLTHHTRMKGKTFQKIISCERSGPKIMKFKGSRYLTVEEKLKIMNESISDFSGKSIDVVFQN